MYSLTCLPSSIFVGRASENNYRTIEFDVSDWVNKYPQAYIYIAAYRPDGYVYLPEIERYGEKLIWNVNDVDTAAPGTGEIELRVGAPELLGKSQKIMTFVATSITGTVPPPPPDWTEEAAALDARVKALEEQDPAALTVVTANITGTEITNPSHGFAQIAIAAQRQKAIILRLYDTAESQKSMQLSMDMSGRDPDDADTLKITFSNDKARVTVSPDAWTYTAASTGGFDIHALQTEDNIADADETPFYDASAAAQRKTTWSNVKAKLKAYFDNIYLTEHQSLADYASKAWVEAKGYITSLAGYATEAWVTAKDYATKSFVNSSIGTNTAYYISNNGQPFQSLAQLQAYSGTVTNNDYAFVVGTDAAGNTTYTRYKYNSASAMWGVEYVLNNSSFTAAQWAAIQSGITSGDVALIRTALQPGALDDYALKDDLDDYVEINQGIANVNKVLAVGADGNVTVKAITAIIANGDEVSY